MSEFSELTSLRQSLKNARREQGDKISSVTKILTEICRVAQQSKDKRLKQHASSLNTSHLHKGDAFNKDNYFRETIQESERHAPDHRNHPDGPTFYSHRTLGDQLGMLRVQIDASKADLHRRRKMLQKEAQEQEITLHKVISSASNALKEQPIDNQIYRNSDSRADAFSQSKRRVSKNVMADSNGRRRVFSFVRNMIASYTQHEAEQNELEAKRSTEDRLGVIALAMATENLSQKAKESAKISHSKIGRGRSRRKSTFLRAVLSKSEQFHSAGKIGASVSAKWLTDENAKSSLKPSQTLGSKKEDKQTSEPMEDGKLRVPRKFLESIFRRMDRDQSGQVDRDEFLAGVTSDVYMKKMFSMKIGDDVNTTFKDVFNRIDEDRSNMISLDEFVAFFEIHDVDTHSAGDTVDAIYEEEDSWYVARIVKAVENAGRVGATEYMLRFRGYEEDGLFKVPASGVRSRFEAGDPCQVMIENNINPIPAVVESQTEEGYTVRIPTKGNRTATIFASDVFNMFTNNS